MMLINKFLSPGREIPDVTMWCYPLLGSQENKYRYFWFLKESGTKKELSGRSGEPTSTALKEMVINVKILAEVQDLILRGLNPADMS